MRTLLQADGALITTMNRVRLLFNRQDFTKALFADLRTATHHIHIEAYTIEPDGVGKALVQLLTQKAEQGVRVRVIYDTFGSHRLNRAFWRPLVQAGGQVEPFLATRLGRANLRINFRNHRKITVIDGQVAYMGGFDIGSTSRKLAITRDTQLRLTGQAVASLQARFFMDWNTTAKIKKVHFQKAYFPDPADNGRTTMQIVGGGPEQKLEPSNWGTCDCWRWPSGAFGCNPRSLCRMIHCWTPGAGGAVRYRCAGDGAGAHESADDGQGDRILPEPAGEAGVRVYRYQAGFLHSKAIIVDSQYLMTGSPNLDVRSFKLNFEIAAFIYDQTLAEMVERQFKLDMAQATPYTYAMVKNQSHASQLGADLARLFAPIL